MKKELSFLSLPDHLNKYICANYNQRLNLKNNLCLRFQIFNAQNRGNAIKAIYLLETIFPKKVVSFKLKIKKNKDFQKKNSIIIFNFDLNLSGYEFIDMLRFFSYTPLAVRDIKNLDYVPIVNRKLKNFNYSSRLKIIPKALNQSFNFLKLYHFD